ncbi:hypothetical protein AVEN_259562-1 [Araneus ventricosus]|uniref:Uncharacterized protein n=1 Tax=Araneus ventricosus TaxID=182803 RepID=A0A4Y2EPA9_ARAVE|nr:hypothetical protein AVEN_259562-1 [Araneus ventricosus]
MGGQGPNTAGHQECKHFCSRNQAATSEKSRYTPKGSRQGKKKFMNVLNRTELKQGVNIFRDKSACPDDIDEVGQKVLIALYRGRTVKN